MSPSLCQTVFLMSVISLGSACSHHHAATTVATRPTPPTTIPGPAKQEPVTPAVAASPNLAVEAELGKRCGLQLADVSKAPKFSFDDAALLPEDRAVLDQVVTCVTKGPLKGHVLHLIGRADPRGTEEYNLGLGERRARMVDDYLTRSGVAANQVTTMTRGELDARGTDEAGWQLDRRVDLQLN